MNGTDNAPTAAHVAIDLGSRRYPILGDAPGEYVHER
jgi:hypothetical protein